MEVVNLIRPARQPVLLVRQAPGEVRLVRPVDAQPVRLIANRGPIYFGETAVLPSLPLVVTQDGQTVWDLGLSEVRRTLWVGGLRYFEADDYTIALPLLTWHGSFVLRRHHTIFLTN